MNKDYYFQHDYNPTNDPKVQAMLSVYGDWGYGLFWRMIEMLHREGEHAILMKRYVFTSFAQHKSTSVEQVEAFVNDCINEFELFASDGSRFWSERVNRNIGKRSEISESRSKAGRASAEAKKAAALAQQMSTGVEQVLTGVQHNSTKEIKEKESKEKKEDKGTHAELLEWNRKPKAEDVPDPSDMTVDAIRERQYQLGNKNVTKEDVLAYWRSWLPIEITGDKHYQTRSEVYRHFANRCEKISITPVVKLPNNNNGATAIKSSSRPL